MTTADLGVELLDSLQTLKIAVRDLRQEAEQSLSHPEASLENLRATINSLGQGKPAKRVVVPQDYLRQWQEFLTGNRQQLEIRAVRYLCWEPEVATDERFQSYLDREHIELKARSLQGLVRSCHARWPLTFASGSVVARIRRRLKIYKGTNHFLSRWKDVLPMILGARGAEDFADDLMEHIQPIKTHCDSWGVEEQSLYVQQAIQHAALRSREHLARDVRLGQYLLKEILPWSIWPIEKFKDEVNATILCSTLTEPFKETLRDLILSNPRLGDPRFPRNRSNWLGVSDNARRRLIEWLSRADIVFFFEHCLPRGTDPHGRKSFWLRYVGGRDLVSRPLLNWEDKGRLQTILRQNRDQVGHFGNIDGETSAFLLDFDSVVVIEFSQKNNACYIYEKRALDRVVSDFWAAQPFTIPRLKQKSLCVESVSHIAGWQQKMAGILARYGIRPV